jgi:hypothetical protein
MPYATLEIPVPKDQKATAERIKILTEIGLPMSSKWVYEELGIPEPQEGEMLLTQQGTAPAADPADDMVVDPADDLVVDPAEDLENYRVEDPPELVPTSEMVTAANAALQARRIAPIGQRGMTAAGLQRARDIAAGIALTPVAKKKMRHFFRPPIPVRLDPRSGRHIKVGVGRQARNGQANDKGRAGRGVEEMAVTDRRGHCRSCR